MQFTTMVGPTIVPRISINQYGTLSSISMKPLAKALFRGPPGNFIFIDVVIPIFMNSTPYKTINI